MKPRLLITAFTAFIVLLMASCSGGGVKTDEPQVDVNELTADQDEVHGTLVKDGDITLENPLNAEWVSAGSAIYELKCQSCHRLDADRVVGPGWKDVTKTRKPAWIMNMITNVDVMLENDGEAQKLLEQCLIRMPNQNISFDEARQLLEFMRNNDGEK
jgi:hypothetical protein